MRHLIREPIGFRRWQLKSSGTFVGLALGAALAFGVLLYLGRNGTFFYDEWALVDRRLPLTLDALMSPHNEHWSLLLVLTYAVLFSLFGFWSYIPYLAVLLVLHIVAAAGLFRVLRPVAGIQLTAIAAGLFLFLGGAHENLFWAFQMGFVGATAAGVWALESVQARRSPLIPSALLLVSVATTGVGLFFVASVGAYLLAERRRWVEVGVTVLPAIAAYGLWYLTYGRAAVSLHRDPFTWDALGQVPTFVVAGGAGGFAAITGMGQDVGLVAFVAVVGASLLALYNGRPNPLMLAAVAGLVAEFSLIGLVRAQYGVEQATAARYVYVSALFALIASLTWIGRPRLRHPLAPLAMLPILVIAVGWNLSQLDLGRSRMAEFAAQTRAEVDLVLRDSALLLTAADQPITYLARPSRVRALVAEHGSPIDDALEPGASPIEPEAWDVALFQLVERELRGRRLSSLPDDLSDIQLIASFDVATRDDGLCVHARVVGPDPWVTVYAPRREELILRSDANGMVQLFIYWHVEPQEEASTAIPVRFDAPYSVAVPFLADPLVKLRIDPPEGSDQLVVCGR